MPTVPHTLWIRRRRERKNLHAPAHLFGLAGFGFGVLFTLVAILTITGISVAYTSLTAGMPPLDTLPRLLEPPDGLLLEPTRLYDRSGEHVILVLDVDPASPRSYLPLEGERSVGLPEALVQATIAASDPDFWEHPGFRLSWNLLDGPPTLAQRLVSDLLLWDEAPGVRFELRERLLAAQITARYGREKVLEWYLNSADYGNYAFGAEAAARAYLGKSASQLTTGEAALLAGVSEAPALNPWDAPRAARDRQNEILERMAQIGLISQGELRKAAQEEVRILLANGQPQNLAPAFSALALEGLSVRMDAGRLARGGLKVLTTLDFDLQGQVACTVSAQIARLEGRQVESTPLAEDYPCPAAALLPLLPGEGQSKPGQLSANALVLDPASGQVLAMVGEDRPGLNPGLSPGHPPGTLLTPFIYLTAFTRGWSPSSMAWDIPSRLPADLADLRNLDGTFHGPQRLRVAMANDYLVPAAQLLEEIGEDQVWHLAQQLGLKRFGSLEGGSLRSLDKGNAWQEAFEESEITLLEAVQAYGAFANDGLLVGQSGYELENSGDTTLQPVTIIQVSGLDGRLYLDCTNQPTNCQIETRTVISSQLAYLITHILSDEQARWPSLGHPNPLEIGRPAAAKTGRTFESPDAWTVGYTPQLVVGAWMSAGDTGRENSPEVNPAAVLWHAIIQYATRDLAPIGWNPPPGISSITVCDPSGMLPTENCPAIVEEVFLNGAEPAHEDSLFRAFLVNRESGLLATIFTPPGLVEERVYMILPPEAGDWADAAGLPAVPQVYDRIGITSSGDKAAAMRAPEMFATVSGKVTFTGHAEVEGFKYYRLQAGQGLNPTAWLKIGEDMTEPVDGGQLGIWDTAGLNGLYSVQLLVVAEEGRVKTATVQITVDNQAPQVSVRYPINGDRLVYPEVSHVTFQIEASDELGLASVEVILDGKQVTVLSAPPFAYRWPAKVGEHHLLVRARDLAGNSEEAEIDFRIERK